MYRILGIVHKVHCSLGRGRVLHMAGALPEFAQQVTALVADGHSRRCSRGPLEQLASIWKVVWSSATWNTSLQSTGVTYQKQNFTMWQLRQQWKLQSQHKAPKRTSPAFSQASRRRENKTKNVESSLHIIWNIHQKPVILAGAPQKLGETISSATHIISLAAQRNCVLCADTKSK